MWFVCLLVNFARSNTRVTSSTSNHYACPFSLSLSLYLFFWLFTDGHHDTHFSYPVFNAGWVLFHVYSSGQFGFYWNWTR